MNEPEKGDGSADKSRTSFRALVGVVGAIILITAGIRMLQVNETDFDSFIHAAGIFAIGTASIPLLLIGLGKDDS